MIKIVSIYILITLLYAIIRYNIFGGVPFHDIPTYILNKSISFTMILLLATIIYKQIKGYKDEVLELIRSFKILTFIHILLSLSLLSKTYYSRLFTDEGLNLFGNLTILFGILALTYMYFVKTKFNYLLFLVFIALHLVFLGVKVWFNVDKWLGYMPPISLICFLTVAFLAILVKYNSLHDDFNS